MEASIWRSSVSATPPIPLNSPRLKRFVSTPKQKSPTPDADSRRETNRSRAICLSSSRPKTAAASDRNSMLPKLPQHRVSKGSGHRAETQVTAASISRRSKSTDFGELRNIPIRAMPMPPAPWHHWQGNGASAESAERRRSAQLDSEGENTWFSNSTHSSATSRNTSSPDAL